MNERLKQGITSPYILTCVGFIAVSITAFFAQPPVTREFVVRAYQEQDYYVLTDEITADAAIIYDLAHDRIIAGKNPATPESIASITKLMAALIAFPQIAESDTTTITEDDFLLAPNTDIALGDVWRTSDLLAYSLITSSNRGINAVGRTIEQKSGKSLVELMNVFVREHGLIHTHFLNLTGLDAHATLAGSESSALDLARIAGSIVRTHRDLAQVTAEQKKVFYTVNGTAYVAKNTNELIGAIADRVLLSKTGLTPLAGGALIMVVEHAHRQFALVVLGSTGEERFTDMEVLLAYLRGSDSAVQRILSE